MTTDPRERPEARALASLDSWLSRPLRHSGAEARKALLLHLEEQRGGQPAPFESPVATATPERKMHPRLRWAWSGLTLLVGLTLVLWATRDQEPPPFFQKGTLVTVELSSGTIVYIPLTKEIP